MAIWQKLHRFAKISLVVNSMNAAGLLYRTLHQGGLAIQTGLFIGDIGKQ